MQPTDVLILAAALLAFALRIDRRRAPDGTRAPRDDRAGKADGDSRDGSKEEDT